MFEKNVYISMAIPCMIIFAGHLCFDWEIDIGLYQSSANLAIGILFSGCSISQRMIQMRFSLFVWHYQTNHLDSTTHR